MNSSDELKEQEVPTYTWEVKQVGRCAVEYRRSDLDAILPNYDKFIIRDQNAGLPLKLEARPMGVLRDTFTLHHGHGTYGMEADGSFTRLGAIIDSSD